MTKLKINKWEDIPEELLYIRCSDAGRLLNVTALQVRRYCLSGLLPYKKIGKSYIIPKDDLRVLYNRKITTGFVRPITDEEASK